MTETTATTGTAAPKQLTPAERQAVRKNLIGIGMGNLLEWFDWNVYTTFAVYLAAQAFSKEDPTSAFLQTLATFAVGFIARPFGGFLFGWIGDRRGRKFSLTLAILFASFGSLLIAALPSFADVGVFASVMLVVARIIQGLAHGGELPSSQVFLSEVAPDRHRGLWSSWIYVSGTAGVLLGVIFGAVLNVALTPEQLDSFGWRIPFVVGALAGLYTLYLRRNMKETDNFTEAQEAGLIRENIFMQLFRHWGAALKVIGLTVGITVAYYVWAISAPTYANKVLGMDRGETLWAGIIGNIVLIIALPVWGILADRWGRKPVMMLSAFSTAVLTLPLNAIELDNFVSLTLGISGMSLLLAGALSIMPALFAELFPAEVRTAGVGLPYSIAVALFGGTAPMLQAWSADLAFDFFPYYVVGLLVLTGGTVLLTRETKGIVLDEAHKL